MPHFARLRRPHPRPDRRSEERLGQSRKEPATSMVRRLPYINGQFLRPRPSIGGRVLAPTTTLPSAPTHPATSPRPGEIAYSRSRSTALSESQKRDPMSRKRIEAAGEFGEQLPHGNRTTNSGMSLALGMANPQQAAAVMKWDLVNPWARVYELNSTHPLTALRVRALQPQRRRCVNPSATPRQTEYGRPQNPLGRIPRGVLLLDRALRLHRCTALRGHLPPLTPYSGRQPAAPTNPRLLIAVGTTWAMRIAFRYRGTFEQKKIGQLLEDLDDSR